MKSSRVSDTIQPQSPQEFSVFGVPVHLCNDYANWLGERLCQGKGTHLITLNPEMVMLAESNNDFAEVLKQAELVVPDGAGVVMYLRLKGKVQKRCPGIELAASLIEKAGEIGKSCPVLFYGGAPGVTEAAANFWQQQLPNLSVKSYHGYLNPQSEQELITTLQTQQPKLILVGIGVPRQELWISKHRHLAPNSIWIGVGGSFDIWSGGKSRAPVWLRENNLEWLYRLYQEPWRWRRMLVLPRFALRALVSQ